MSPFFDELESQLRSAARGVAGAPDAPRARRPRRRRTWWPAGLELAPVLASVVVVVVVGAALVLLGRGGGRQPTPPASPPPNGGLAALIQHTPQKQLRREFAYMAAATRRVQASKQCQVQQASGVSFVHRTPDSQLLSLLGVLRRPATAADRVDHRLLDGTGNIYSGSIRHAASIDGESYYLAVYGLDRATSIPSDHCFALQAQALANYLPKIPAALRAQTTALQAGYIAWARNLYTHSPRDAVCLLLVGKNGGGSNCGITAGEIKSGMSPTNDQGTFNGLVPDGVASVTVSIPAAPGRPARSGSGPAIGNVYAIRIPAAAQTVTEPSVTWRSAEGRVIKRIPAPSPALDREACRKQPIPCALIQDGGVTSTSSSSSRTTRAAPVQTRSR